MASINRSSNGTVHNGVGLQGTGAAYIRVSTDHQDTDRQHSAIASFSKQHSVTIAPAYRFEDQGWARDEADKRPAFQRLVKLAETGVVKWIVVDKLDRFGTKNSKQLVSYLYRLEEAGCRLFDASGRCWSDEDIATIITAVVEAEKSKGEQTDKSHRVLGGKIEKAKAGEWQGGPVRLGFDVVCYDRKSDKELWRVLIEGRNKRVKAWPNGKKERFDGVGNFPKVQPTEVLRIAPSKDKTKIAAAVSVFKRFATEAISLTTLAHHLNKLDFRNGFGGMFQGQQVEAMLEDPAYLGYYAWNKRHAGKFNRFTDGRIVLEYNYEEAQSKNAEADWVRSKRLFRPLVDQKTWDAVQTKLRKPKRKRSPRSATLYLAGLVYCGNCAGKMVSGSFRNRIEYFCGTYHRSIREGTQSACKCNRNSVFQSDLEGFISRWLEESGKRLEILSEGIDAKQLTAPMQSSFDHKWRDFTEALSRMASYLQTNHPKEYAAVWGNGVDVDELIEAYRRRFSPKEIARELKRLEAEHDAMTDKVLNLPRPSRALEKAQEQLLALEAEIQNVEGQSANAADVAEGHLREIRELQTAIRKAKAAMKGDGERGLRQRAEALGKVIDRIECHFQATGKKGGGWGKKNARLARVIIRPKTGETAEFSLDSESAIQKNKAWALHYYEVQ